MTRFPIRMLQHPRALNRGRTAAGFTLIELMIVVAIVAILVAAAVASYRWAVVKSHRGAAKGCLMESAQYMERFYTTNMAYDKDMAGTAVALPGTCSTDAGDFYNMGFVGTPTATTFAIQAVPISGKQDDSLCGTLTIDQAGTKGASGSGGVDSCW
ncbi:type IV pilin protein [Cognatiluteimonas sedimenti]|nr:type IV pilin protein [Lysobacter sedimenti]